MAVHAAKRHGREREGGREGDWEGRGKEERQTTQTAAGEGEKLPNAEEGKRRKVRGRTEWRWRTPRQREQRGRDRETPTQTDRRMIVPPATAGRSEGRQGWHRQEHNFGIFNHVSSVARARHSFPARSRVQITSLNSPDENPMRRSRSGFYFASHQPISTHCASYSISSRFDAQRLCTSALLAQRRLRGPHGRTWSASANENASNTPNYAS